MSSRRGAGEENILAMLERDSARRPGSRMSGMRLASYGAAAALAGILAGGVAWLAYDNHTTAQGLQPEYGLANVAAPPVMGDAALPPPVSPVPPAAVTAPAPAPVPDPARSAVIVDESARERQAAAASAPPPLVMLPPHEVTGAKPPPATPRPTQESVRPKRVKSAAPAPARPAAQKKADKAPKLASRATKPAPARGANTAKARPEPARTRKAEATAAAPVDSDVALISAIIQHSERHRGDRSDRDSGACSGPKCPPKPTRP
jgi:hypothetical protein